MARQRSSDEFGTHGQAMELACRTGGFKTLAAPTQVRNLRRSISGRLILVIGQWWVIGVSAQTKLPA